MEQTNMSTGRKGAGKAKKLTGRRAGRWGTQVDKQAGSRKADEKAVG